MASMAAHWRWPLFKEGGPSYLPLSTSSLSPPPSSATSTSSSTASTSTSASASLGSRLASLNSTPSASLAKRPISRRCASIFSSKAAVVLIALVGCIAHLYTFTYLGVMRETMPQVPSVIWHDVTSAAPSVVVLDSEMRNSTAAYALANKTSTTSIGAKDAPSEANATSISGTRWFNLLPKRPDFAHTERARSHAEQRSWQAAQIATSVARFYNFIGAIICTAGAYGAIRSNVFILRTFLLFAILDTIIFTLTAVSLGIIVSYADVRALLCESIASGEVHAFFAYLRGHREGIAVPAPPDSPTYVDAAKAAAAAATTLARRATKHTRSLAERGSAEDLSMAILPASLLSRTTQGLWKRTADAASASSEAASGSLWRWDTWLDDLLENESCDDVFATYIVPFGVLACLITLLVRIRLIFVVRSHYVDILRKAAVAQDPNQASAIAIMPEPSNKSTRQTRLSEKVAFLSPDRSLSRNKPQSDRIRQMQEKMA